MSAKLIAINGGLKQKPPAEGEDECLFSLELIAGGDNVIRGGAYITANPSAADLAHIHTILLSHARRIMEQYEEMASKEE